MKRTLLFLSILSLSLFNSCKEDPKIGDASSKLNGINASWEVFEVIQSYPTLTGKVEWDVTYHYQNDEGNLEVTFNSDDFSYDVSAPGMNNIFGEGGSWAYDNDQFPTQVTLSQGSGEELVLPLGAVVREVDQFLHLVYERDCGGEAYITYDFIFTRKS